MKNSAGGNDKVLDEKVRLQCEKYNRPHDYTKWRNGQERERIGIGVLFDMGWNKHQEKIDMIVSQGIYT